MWKTIRNNLIIFFILTCSALAQTNTAPKVFVDGEADYLNRGAFLYTSVSDDALLKPVTYYWTKLSGPGNITWSAQQKPMTHVQFSATGLYVIQCAVSDGQFIVTDKIVIMASNEADITVKP